MYCVTVYTGRRGFEDAHYLSQMKGGDAERKREAESAVL